MTTFSDIFKRSFLEGFSGTPLTTESILVVLGITTILAFYIFGVYRYVTRKTFYSKNFNISLVAMSLITAAVILTIQSNIIISLGMVGALSIVRFRTAIKDPMDLVFLFWSLVVGIICGAGMAQIAVLLSAIVTICILILQLLPVSKAPLILVVNATNPQLFAEIEQCLKQYTAHYQIKSRSITATTLDLVVEIRTKEEQKLLDRLMLCQGLTYASLLDHDGEVTF